MSQRQLLRPIFLKSRKSDPTEKKLLLKQLLSKPVEWKQFDIYTPLEDQQAQENYHPPLRWDWDTQGTDQLRLRYYWAIQTMSRIILNITEQTPPPSLQFQNSSSLKKYNQLINKKPLNAYSALAFTHLFWCYHESINFTGWHNAYMKAFQQWLRLSDNLNLLFQGNFTGLLGIQQINPKYFEPLSDLTQDAKKQIIIAYNKGEIPDQLSLPFWNWNRLHRPTVKNQSQNLQVHYPYRMNVNITKINYSAFYFDPSNPKTGLDNDFSRTGRYYASMTADFQEFYLDTQYDSLELLGLSVPFFAQREKILDGKGKITSFNPPQRFNFLLSRRGTNSGMLFYLQDLRDVTSTKNPFAQISTSLERGPHNNIHNACGYPMENVPDAGFHPIFWLHHCNIQRMRQLLLRKLHSQSDYPQFAQGFLTGLSPDLYNVLPPSQNPNTEVRTPIENKNIRYFPFSKFDKNYSVGKITLSRHPTYHQSDLIFHKIIQYPIGYHIQQMQPYNLNTFQVEVEINRTLIRNSITIQIYNIPDHQLSRFQAYMKSNCVVSRQLDSHIKMDKDFEFVGLINIFAGREGCQNCNQIKTTTLATKLKFPKNKINLHFAFVRTSGNFTIRRLLAPKGIKFNCGLLSKESYTNRKALKLI